jgi:hypothetical protein
LALKFRVKKRQTICEIESKNIHVFADIPHLLKNLRNAFLSRIIILPQQICDNNDLPTNQIPSGYIKQLWISEIESDSSLRSLFHLNKAHLFPTHYNSMNVALAVQLFSVKTAAALEKAVSLKQIGKAALATAWFLRLVNQWFTMVTARHVKVGITQKNKEEKILFLECFIEVIQETQFGNGWKPVQTGLILSTKNIIHLTNNLFSEGFHFFLPGRLTQDALENTLSQIRRRSGSKPTALQAKRALRLISISQYISDIENTNYSSDTDFHLLDPKYFKVLDDEISALNSVVIPPVDAPSSNQPSTSQSSNKVLATQSSRKVSPNILAAEKNDIYYISGATLNAMMKKKICNLCIAALKEAEDSGEPAVPHYRTLLVQYADMGGLQKPESGIYRICRETERVFQRTSVS